MCKESIYFQCLKCGEVNEIDSKYTPKEDVIYVDLYCPHCGRLTRQLYCYDNVDDLVIYKDITLDKRYY
jgi:predicted RNA-binding Zn-ribbon protein involved in translation (DUF1610 family)